jgi:hypothetical protein
VASHMNMVACPTSDWGHKNGCRYVYWYDTGGYGGGGHVGTLGNNWTLLLCDSIDPTCLSLGGEWGRFAG